MVSRDMQRGTRKRSRPMPALGSVMKEVASYLERTGQKRIILNKPRDENDVYVVEEENQTARSN